MFCGFLFSGAARFGAGGLGIANDSLRFSTRGVGVATLGVLAEMSTWELLGSNLSLGGTAKGVRGLLTGGPLLLKDGRLFRGTLTGGRAGGTSATGVGGR